MDRVIWVETLGRHGVTHRQRFERLPITIGRGYGNDVVLDDPHADATHVRISAAEDGTLIIEDLGTVNGTRIDGRELRIGRTQLRVATADQPVPAALPAVPQGPVARFATSRRAALLVPLIGTALLMLQAWLSDSQNDEAAVAGFAVLAALMIAGWAGGWALAGRMTIHQPRFLAHQVVAWSALILTFAVSMLFGWADFFTESSALETLATVILPAVIVVQLAAHLGLATTMPPRRRIAIAAVVTLGMTLLVVLFASAEDEFSGETLTIASNLKPVPPGMVPAMSIEEFLERSTKLREEIDELAGK